MSKDYSLLKRPVDATAERAIILAGLQSAGSLVQETGNEVQNTAARFGSAVSPLTRMGIKGFIVIPEASLARKAGPAFTVERNNVSQLRPGQKLMSHDIT